MGAAPIWGSFVWMFSNQSCPCAAGNPALLGRGSTALTRIWVIAFQHFGLRAKIEVNHMWPGAIMREAYKGAETNTVLQGPEAGRMQSCWSWGSCASFCAGVL